MQVSDLARYVGQSVEAQLPQRDERAVCTEKEETQTGAVHCQLFDIGLLKGQVPQDDGYLQNALTLHIRDAHIPLWVKQHRLHGILLHAIWRKQNTRKALVGLNSVSSDGEA